MSFVPKKSLLDATNFKGISIVFSIKKKKNLITSGKKPH